MERGRVRRRTREREIERQLIFLSTTSQETLRTALAMGADRAMHVECGQEDYSDLGPLAVANILAKLIQKEDVNLVILGKQVWLPLP